MNQNAEYCAVNDAVRGQFFRRTWAMITPYWRSEEKGKAWVLLNRPRYSAPGLPKAATTKLPTRSAAPATDAVLRAVAPLTRTAAPDRAEQLIRSEVWRR